ncbi:Receptor-like kinase [Melia azedarach]|uniref:Receptor-like kinase n=1 Tax=Melia azedarach TaxID=155640 RepID=A0ACC1YSP9_MELAZ|nr:Receptor-like kinase [Melia azedarach]
MMFLNINTANAVPVNHTTAKLGTSWLNNELSVRESYEFNDGTKVRIILVYVSNGHPTFGFGFLRNSTDEIFYLVTIRFSGYTSSIEHHDFPPVILWSANGNSPVKENAKLELTAGGDLNLTDVNGHQVWSTDTSGRNVTRMTLEGNGNLKLCDAKSKAQWQSFIHPTNTWLPGQYLHVHKKLHSTVSTSNLSTGNFYLILSPGAIRVLFNQSTANLYQTIPYRKTFPYGMEFHHHANYVSYKTQGKSFHYMRLESNGHLNVYKLAKGNTESSDISRDQYYGNCIYPTYCGHYGVCSDDHCRCPGAGNRKSNYFKQVKDVEYGFSCAEVTRLSCQTTQLQNFLELQRVTYFEFVPDHINTDVESCKKACMSNCSCKAALFRYHSNISIGNCSLPTELYSLRTSIKAISHYNALTFIKVQMPPDQSTLSLFFLLVFSVSVFLVLIIGACTLFYMRWWKGKRVKRQRKDNSIDESSVDVANHLRKFSLEVMKSATRDFQVRLGRGGFGCVFEGFLDDGTKVAVKRLCSGENQGRKEFLSEVETIGNIHHFNLVRLVGYCAERSNRLLVYEYMCNGSLDKWIFHQNEAQTLTWEIRKKIIVQIAKGLEYLHDYCNPNIIHFDIKPQNILLDKDFNVRISDFGLARLIHNDQSHLLTTPKGTPGYIAPELIRGNNITAKIDIYSFGIVILEIICGRKSSNPGLGDYLIDTVKIKAEGGQLSDLVDKRSEDMQRRIKDAVKMIQIAISCLQTKLYRRPSASMLVKVLEGLTNLEPVTDYSFLNFAHQETPQEANPVDTSTVIASALSGPR